MGINFKINLFSYREIFVNFDENKSSEGIEGLKMYYCFTLYCTFISKISKFLYVVLLKSFPVRRFFQIFIIQLLSNDSLYIMLNNFKLKIFFSTHIYSIYRISHQLRSTSILFSDILQTILLKVKIICILNLLLT